jgi:hypothetical protein
MCARASIVEIPDRKTMQVTVCQEEDYLVYNNKEQQQQH